MSRVVLNGKLVDEAEALVSLLDRNVQLGMNVFETMLAESRVIDGFDLHVARLVRGVERLQITVDGIDEKSLTEAISSLLEANGLAAKQARIRITVMESNTIIQSSVAATPRVVCSAVISEYVLNERSPTTGIKCGSYAPNMVAMREVDADEVIFLNTLGHVAESAMANIFLVSDGVLITPSLNSGCLPGVTRALLIRRARVAGMEVQECVVKLEDLFDADEVFLTNSVIGVCGVERIGEVEITNGLGLVSNKVKQIYQNGDQ